MKTHPLLKFLQKIFAHLAVTMVACLWCSHVAVAQKIDSLKMAIVEYHRDDTTAVNILIEIANIYKATNRDSMKAAASKALVLAEKNKFNTGIGTALYLTGVANAIENKNDTALIYYNRALSVFHKAGLTDKECMTLYNINVSYYHQNKLDLALTTLKTCIDLAEKTHNYQRTCRALLGMGDIYRDKADYSGALNTYLKALSLYEKNNFIPGIAETYRDIADIYSLLGNFPKALEYLNKSNAIYKTSDDIQAVIVNYTSVGSIYGQMKDYTNSLIAYKAGLHLADSTNNHLRKEVCYIDIGEIYSALGLLDSALAAYNAGIKECELSQDKMGWVYAQRGLGAALVKKGKITEGIKYLIEAYSFVKKEDIKREVVETSLLLSNAYEKNKDYANALKYHQIYHSYFDTLFNESNEKKVQQLQFDYELEKKEGQIGLLEKEKLAKQAKLYKQRGILWGLGSGIALLVVIIYLLSRSRMKEKKTQQITLQQKNEIQQQATKLEELNNFKDKTFSVLSHDMRGPLNAFTATMTMLDEESISKEEFAEIKPELNKQLNSLNILLDNLLKWSKSHMQGDAGVNPEQLNIYKITQENIDLVQSSASRKQITITNSMPEHTAAFADKGQVDIVIRNLINNALKFTNNGGRIDLSAKEVDNSIEIYVSDDGVGMTPEQQKKLFIIAPEKSTYGTGGEKGIGLGLLLCYEFIKANNGDIRVTSEVGKGSTFVVTLPRK